MTVFITWIGISALFLVLYTLFLWRRTRHRSRFQAKLTVFFLLFVFIPTVPLTFFAANLLTRSADVLLLPGIGEALETSLSTIRFQLERRGERFLEQHDDPAGWSPGLLEANGIEVLGCYRGLRDSLITVCEIQHPRVPLPDSWRPSRTALERALSTDRSSTLMPVADEEMVLVYHRLAVNILLVAGYRVPRRVGDAKDQVTRALGVYNTLSLIKESIIQKNLIWGLAVIFIIGLTALSIIAARRLSREISEPIQGLVSGMRRVADGDLSQRVETAAKDEFRFLVDSFNQMVKDLDAYRLRLIQAERLAAWQRVARQISHEIKNSLTPISISLHRLYSHSRESAASDSFNANLKAVEEELRALESMAAEFSEFARMPRPQISLINLNDVVRTVVRLTEPAAGRIKIEMRLAAEIPPVDADRDQMKRCLNNLLKNSIEASRETGKITVITREVRSGGNCIEIEIRDNGAGMDEATLEKIFEPYFTTKERGTGLGLAIVRKIIEDHHGEIRMQSKKGVGTRVTIRLWLRRSDHDTNPPDKKS